MTLLQASHVVLLGCSNGKGKTTQAQDNLNALVKLLTSQYGAKVTIRPSIWLDEETGGHCPAELRADYLAHALADSEVDWIMDLTGGDLANQTLAALPQKFFQQLNRQKPVYYMGYSDNSVILNACLAHDMILPVNFFPLALVLDPASRAIFEAFLQNKPGDNLEAFGGNIRCFLKLAGTSFWPQDIVGRRLYLEASSGSLERIQSMLVQLSQLITLDDLSEICLGQFNELDDKGQRPILVDYLSSMTETTITENSYLGHRFPLAPFIYHSISDATLPEN
jgi:hypothetical protein